jgi:hypothetical protein
MHLTVDSLSPFSSANTIFLAAGDLQGDKTQNIRTTYNITIKFTDIPNLPYLRRGHILPEMSFCPQNIKRLAVIHY